MPGISKNKFTIPQCRTEISISLVLITINFVNTADLPSWDNYVLTHPHSTIYHLSGWKSVIEKSYHHKTYYLAATDSSGPTPRLVGILPLVHLKHFIFGNTLISIPFFDTGGILADNETVAKALLQESIKLAQNLKVNSIELRHTQSINNSEPKIRNCPSFIRSNKVRMVLPLPDTAKGLMASFKSKLRSQIRKPIKEGLIVKIGRMELLDDFYSVFSVNMRDLGSPVHSKNLIRNTLEEFSKHSRIVVVYKSQQALAASIIVGLKDMMANPWASSLREYSRLSPNMLLYWAMLEYACENGYQFFDFGRSTPGEGTYRFKKQWGAEEKPLYWLYVSMCGGNTAAGQSVKDKFDKFTDCWKKMPVAVTTIIGPLIRKNIGL